jgi:hypothetical protein
MQDNKLIAEFMGLECEEERFPKEGNLYWIGDDWVNTWNMKYHTSWDWLMPVVESCFERLDARDNSADEIKRKLETCHIDYVYNSVVEFIKTYNDATVNNTKR